MNKNETVELILELIRKFTEEFLLNPSVSLNSEEIAEKLNLTRSSISRYLNICYDERQLIKINTRPVVYLDVKIVEKYTGKVTVYDYLSIDEFLLKNHFNKNNYDFEDLIGHKETLFEIISSLKSEVNYPGNRILAFHFIGSKGVGKKKLASSLLRYCNENKIKDLNESLFVYKATNNSAGKDLLFGPDGFIHKAKKGFLYIDRADQMSYEIQEMFANYLSSFEEKKTEIKCIIFASEENNMIEPLQYKMTSSYLIPDLKNRTKLEREICVARFLKEESVKFEKEIRISKFAFQTLSLSEYSNNFDGLRSSVIKVLANANMSSESELVIKTFNLVDLIPDYHYLLNSEGDNTILSLKEIDRLLNQDELLTKYDQFIRVYDQFARFKINTDTYFKDSGFVLNSISDYLILNMNINNDKFNSLTMLISNICDLMRNRYSIYIYKNMVLMLAKVIYKLAYLDSNIRDWVKQNQSSLEKIKELYTKRYEKAAIIADEIVKLIRQFIEIELDPVTHFNVILLIANENEIIHKDYGALIIAHGYATASSIANTANKLLSRHVFDAIDMPLDASTLDIAEKMDSYLSDSVFMRNLILLVDMGSLEEITSMIEHYENVRIGLINNVSTKIALSVGEGIINGKNMENIMHDAQQHSLSNYKIVAKNEDQPVIVFVSEAGESVSNKFIQLFDISLPRKIDVKTMSYDYFDLMKNKENDGLFKNYNILLILGINTKISNCPFIPFEELLTNESMYILDNILKGMSYDEEEIREFNANILKYYSLENVMNTITILNVNVLIDLIEDALKKLQISLSMKLEPKVMYGLFIHLGSLIERLVMKSSANIYNEIDRFEIEEKEFISSVRKSFEKLMRYYNVEIPIEEIAYLHDYIMNWI